MNVSYRKSRRENILAMIAIQKNDGFQHQYYLTSKRLEGLFLRGEQFFLAVSDGTPVGFGSVDCEVRAQVHFICVDKEYSRRGVGRNLMKLCLKEAKQRGCKRVCSYVEKHSSKESFLVRMGFHEVGVYKDRYGNGVDASIWEISLN